MAGVTTAAGAGPEESGLQPQRTHAPANANSVFENSTERRLLVLVLLWAFAEESENEADSCACVFQTRSTPTTAKFAALGFIQVI
jgi:hypothetical protein